MQSFNVCCLQRVIGLNYASFWCDDCIMFSVSDSGKIDIFLKENLTDNYDIQKT